MTVRMSEREARRAGLTAPKPRTTRKTAPREPGTTSRCVTCGQVFATVAAEDRHVNETRHGRYEVLT